MKKIILTIGLIGLWFLNGNAQSFLLTPSDGFLKSSQPDLYLTGSGDVEIRGQRSSGTISSPAAVFNNSVLLNLIGEGHNGTFFTGEKVRIRLASAEAWSSTANGTWIQFSTTTNGTISMVERMRITNDGNVGIGVTVPEAKLHVGTGGMTIDHDNSATDRINFKLNNPIASAGMYFNSAAGSILGGLAHQQIRTQLWRGGNSNFGMTISDNNYVGLNNSSPGVPFHINYSTTSTSSTTGGMILGPLNSLHLTFDTNEINAYSNTTGSNLVLNEESGGDVYIGGTSASNNSNLRVNGYSRLGGSSAPNIKMIRFRGLTDGDDTTIIPHGLTSTKIISVTAAIETSGVFYAPGSNFSVGFQYDLYWTSSSIYLSQVGGNLQNDDYVVTIIYEE